ncbi:MAG TPA: patatin-like phospholipase family protein, partial [Xanthobacteraceae bacterium]
MTDPIPEIARFHEVFRAELKELRERRVHSMPDAVPADVPHPVPSVAHGLTGIALSGGGVRSAVLSLGALQGLQSRRVVDRADYLSTVSGGGYIGTALTVGMSTNGGVFPFCREGDDPGETPEVQHLRDNSRYLLQEGVRSAISALAIYLRGIVMNVIIVVPFLLLGSALLIAFHPDTAHLVSNKYFSWDLTSINVALPLSLIASLAILVLLALYAMIVSVFPILPLESRRRWALTAAIILGLYGLVLVAEVHAWLLRSAFVYQGKIPVQAPGGAQALTPELANRLFAIVKKVVIWAGPLVVAVLPFIKELAAKASAGAAGGWVELGKRLASRAVLIFAAAIVPLALWAVMMQLAYWGTAVSVCSDPNQLLPACNPGPVIDNWQHAPYLLQRILRLREPLEQQSFLRQLYVPLCYGGAAVAVLAFAFLVFNVNANSLHQLYRDRLGSAFLVKRRHPGSDKLEPADLFKLTQTNGQAPYHLINTALNVPGSTFANRRGRNADFFLFSRCFVGSEATGYAPTELVEQATDGLNIGTAMAISGA